MTFQLTDFAVKKAIQSLIKRETPNSMLRIGIAGSGCAGFRYIIEFWDKESKIKDTIIEYKLKNDLEFKDSILRVVVDPKSLKLLEETTLDYEMRLMNHGFKFNNNLAKKLCGCGSSFEM